MLLFKVSTLISIAAVLTTFLLLLCTMSSTLVRHEAWVMQREMCLNKNHPLESTSRELIYQCLFFTQSSISTSI